MIDMTAVYVHIPFCKRRCTYCDFITYANLDAMLPEYLEALQDEILLASFDVAEAKTIYIGGGTPSLMNKKQIAGILDCIRQRFGISEDAEITIEANPGTVHADFYKHIRDLGINRLSLGVQSFDDRDLKVLGRIHTSDEALASFEQARKAGFDNISIDLIFGLPEQTLAGWRKNLAQVERLMPEHLSIYSLILEPGTLLNRWVERGLVALPDDYLVADMFEETLTFLSRLGYVYYEISSWALGESKESRHNKVYWRANEYLGFGAGAVGRVGDRRWRNMANVKEYILKLRQVARSIKVENALGLLSNGGFVQKTDADLGSAVAEVENLSVQEQMREMMMLGLRMTEEGLSEPAFYRRFGRLPDAIFGVEIEDLLKKGLVAWHPFEDGRHLVMTPKAYLLGNLVFRAFV